MKFVGHTMGTPNNTVLEAIDIFSDIKLDAIELVSQPNTPFCIDDDSAKIEEIIKKSKALPDGVITITPYFWDINNADEAKARENIEGLKKAILTAEHMGAKFVRSYGGNETAGGTVQENWDRAVEALKECAPFAEKHGITILIENHPSTMTVTGEASYKLVNAVGSDVIKTLYDPANVLYCSDEDWEYTIDVQRDIIDYVHVKDYFMEGETRRACVAGEGIVPWDKIMKKLNFDGYYAFEYEKKWYPDDLEDADTGMLKCKNYLEGLVK